MYRGILVPAITPFTVQTEILQKYCTFNVEEAQGKSGVYALYIDDNLTYIGSTFNLAVRWSKYEYGNITEGNRKKKNGQRTNCYVNSTVCNAAINEKECELYFYGTQDFKKIEKELLNSDLGLINKNTGRKSK